MSEHQERDVARTVPEIRGMSRDNRNSEDDPYSAISYAAQYGITVELAEGFLARASTHGQVVRQINGHFIAYPEERERACDV